MGDALTKALPLPTPDSPAAPSAPAPAPPAAGPTIRQIQIDGADVPFEAPPHFTDKDIDNALGCKYFQDWLTYKEQAIKVSKIQLQNVDMFGPRVGFMKIKVEAKDPAGNPLPGIIFMRGGSVVILPVLETPKGRHALCIRQGRVPVGEVATWELPAGMLDGDGNFSGVAAKEMKEETGIEMKASDLIDMTAKAFGSYKTQGGKPFRGVYLTPGGSDEFIRVFAFHKTLSEEEFKALEGRVTGCKDESEFIKVQLVPFDDVWKKCPGAPTLTALYLYSQLTKSGEIAAK